MTNHVITSVSRFPLGSLFALLGLAVFAPRPAQGQVEDSDVIRACYVPHAGIVYRIGEPGLRRRCRRRHVEFSWSAGPGANRTVFSGECLVDGATFPLFGTSDGITIDDARVSVDDAPSVVAYVTRSETDDPSTFFQISGELLAIQDTRITLSCDRGESFRLVMIL
jgi:hypothetical protein